MKASDLVKLMEAKGGSFKEKGKAAIEFTRIQNMNTQYQFPFMAKRI